MSGTVIKEFLVSIGFHVDRQFETIPGKLDNITGKVFKLATGVDAAAVAFEIGMAKMAESLEKLYFAAQRTNSTAEGIRATGFALTQMGSSVESANAAIEGLASFIRSNPGGLNLLEHLGVKTRDDTGRIKDTTVLLGELAEQLRKMPFYQAQAYAGLFGIDTRTLLAMRNGLGSFAADYTAMMKAAHLNLTQATSDAHYFMVQLRTLGAALEILGTKVAANLLHGLGDNVKKLRIDLVSNFGEIERVLTNVSKVLLFVADATVTLVTRMVQFLNMLSDSYSTLDDKSKLIVKGFAVVLLAFRSLSTGILSTPLGRMIALMTTLLLLFDDYEVWKKGGKSAIDWGKLDAFTGVTKDLKEVKGVVTAIDYGLNQINDLTAKWGRSLHGEILEGLARIILAYDQITGAKTPQWVLDILKLHRDANGNIVTADGSPTDRDPPGLPGYTQSTTADTETPHPPSLWQSLHRVTLQRMKDSLMFWKAAGLSDEAAAGFVGNEKKESNFDPWAASVDPKTGQQHAGIFQWSSDRRQTILDGTGIDVWSAGHSQQLIAALWELKNRPQDTGDTLNVLQNSKHADGSGPSAGEAAQLISKDFEKSGDNSNDRAYYASDALGILRYMNGQGQGQNPSAKARTSSQPLMTSDSAAAPITQTNNITIHGVNDPAKAAENVAGTMKRTNNDLVRNLKGNSR